MNAYFDALRRYFDFKGRSTRAQLWLFTLIQIALLVAALLIDEQMGTGNGADQGLLAGIIAVVHLIPSLALWVRRLHDTDRSGWWLLIALVPIVGAVVLIVFGCLASTPRPNRFGAASGVKGLVSPETLVQPMAAPAFPPLDQLEKLAKLQASGALRDDEYQQLKANLLGKG